MGRDIVQLPDEELDGEGPSYMTHPFRTVGRLVVRPFRGFASLIAGISFALYDFGIVLGRACTGIDYRREEIDYRRED